jgi:hypothetical protein
MRDAIIAMCLARLEAPSLEAVRADPALAAAMAALLRDCPPLPVVRALIAELDVAAKPRGRPTP